MRAGARLGGRPSQADECSCHSGRSVRVRPLQRCPTSEARGWRTQRSSWEMVSTHTRGGGGTEDVPRELYFAALF